MGRVREKGRCRTRRGDLVVSAAYQSLNLIDPPCQAKAKSCSVSGCLVSG